MISRTTGLIKFKKLKRSLGFTKDREVIGLLESLWMLTQREAKIGDIGRLDNETIAIELEWDGDPNKLVESLVNEGWLDESDEHRLVVHDWHEHAPRYIHAWLKSKGLSFASRATPEATTGTTIDQPVGQTVGQATVATGEGGIPSHSQVITKPNQAPPYPPKGEEAAAEDFLFKQFRALNLAKARAYASQFVGRPIEQIQTAIADYHANSKKFDGPGAIVFFLENGRWPVDGIVSAHDAQRSSQLKQAADEQRRRESILFELSKEWKKVGKWQNATTQEIEAEVERRFSEPAHTSS